VSPFKSFNSLFTKQVKLEGFPPYPFVWFLNAAALFLISPRVHIESAKNVIKNIKVPLLALYAEQDEMIDSQDNKDIFNNAPQSKEIHIFKNGKHNLYASHPMQLNTYIFKFLSKYS
jgi:pimeloyl-ACP methyl ester carboxylesterase